MPRRPPSQPDFGIAHHTTGKVHSVTVRARNADLLLTASIALSPWPAPGGQVNSQIARRPRPLDRAGLDILQQGLRILVYEIDVYKRSAEYRAAMSTGSPRADTTP